MSWFQNPVDEIQKNLVYPILRHFRDESRFFVDYRWRRAILNNIFESKKLLHTIKIKIEGINNQSILRDHKEEQLAYIEKVNFYIDKIEKEFQTKEFQLMLEHFSHQNREIFIRLIELNKTVYNLNFHRIEKVLDHTRQPLLRALFAISSFYMMIVSSKLTFANEHFLMSEVVAETEKHHGKYEEHSHPAYKLYHEHLQYVQKLILENEKEIERFLHAGSHLHHEGRESITKILESVSKGISDISKGDGNYIIITKRNGEREVIHNLGYMHNTQDTIHLINHLAKDKDFARLMLKLDTDTTL